MKVTRYPLPHIVGEYGTVEEFNSTRIECGQWVFWEDRVDSILKGDYNNIKPLHIEVSPTYLCNFACSWCSCGAIRAMSQKSSPHLEKDCVTRLFKSFKKYNIGIQWAGGEPTMYRPFYELVEIASRFKIPQCLFTNGSLLDDDNIKLLVKTNLSFIRFSLNAVTPSIHAKHHGYFQDKGYCKLVKKNFQNTVKLVRDSENKSNPPPSINVSIVVDETNIGDLRKTILFVYDIAKYYKNNIIQYIIIRLVEPYPGVTTQLKQSTKKNLAAIINKFALVDHLKEVGVKLVFPNTDNIYKVKMSHSNLHLSDCLGGSMFAELTPTGNLLHCSDRYGNPNYIVGNILDQSLDNIWNSLRRESTINRINKDNCLITKCPSNSRGRFLNEIFHQIEVFRSRNEMACVENWINDLRIILPRPKHSFYI